MNQLEISNLSIAEKIGQMFFIGIPGPLFDEATAKIINDIRPGGVCLFARNIKEQNQTRSLLNDLRQATPVEPFLSLDQEGGRVDRLRKVLAPMPAAGQLQSVEDAAALGALVGEALSILGFNMDFAPVVDVIDSSRKGLSNGLETRGFGLDKDDVVAMAGAFLGSLREFRILGCLKHFPGLGASEVDSHEELPSVNISRRTLDDTDLFPYRPLLKGEGVAVMVAHAAFPNTDLQEIDLNGKLLPSSLNPRIVTSLLRDELKFPGVTITDDMEMGAIVRNYGMGPACKLAVMAGEDMLAICASPDAIYEGFRAICDAVEIGEIPESRIDESIGRIASLKALFEGPPEFDADRLTEIIELIKKLNQHLN